MKLPSTVSHKSFLTCRANVKQRSSFDFSNLTVINFVFVNSGFAFCCVQRQNVSDYAELILFKRVKVPKLDFYYHPDD